MEEYCEECLKHGVYRKGQLHHIVERSHAVYMKHIEVNFKCLCLDHHTGLQGVHKDREKDLQYKQEMQVELTLMLDKDFYTHKELKELLNASDNSVKAITKTLIQQKEGYRKEDLIFRMMGQRNYL